MTRLNKLELELKETERKLNLFIKSGKHPELVDKMEAKKATLQRQIELLKEAESSKEESNIDDNKITDNVSLKIANELEYEFIKIKTMVNNGQANDISKFTLMNISKKLDQINERKALAKRKGKELNLPDFLTETEKLVASLGNDGNETE